MIPIPIILRLLTILAAVIALVSCATQQPPTLLAHPKWFAPDAFFACTSHDLRAAQLRLAATGWAVSRHDGYIQTEWRTASTQRAQADSFRHAKGFIRDSFRVSVFDTPEGLRIRVDLQEHLNVHTVPVIISESTITHIDNTALTSWQRHIFNGIHTAVCGVPNHFSAPPKTEATPPIPFDNSGTESARPSKHDQARPLI